MMNESERDLEIIRLYIHKKELELSLELAKLGNDFKWMWRILNVFSAFMGGFFGVILYNVIKWLTQ